MIERLLAFLQTFGAWLAFWAVVHQEQVAFIRRLGRHSRELTPGYHWKWPVIEVAETEDGRAFPYVLDPQSLRTRDGVSLIVQLTVTVQVVDVRQYFAKVFDGRKEIQDVAAAELGRAVRKLDAAEVYGDKALQQVSRRIRAAAKEWGMQVSDVEFISCVPARSYRLWNTNVTTVGQE